MARRDTLAINTGYAPNDGLGEPIRSGFIKVNENFETIDARLILGNLPVIVSDTTTVKNITISSSAVITATTAMTINPGVQGTMDNVRIGTTTPRAATFTSLTADTITSNGVVNIIGNLVVSGNVVTQNSSDLVIQDSIINLHTPADLEPLLVNDGKDIGIKFHYYRGGDNHAFLGWANDSGSLEYYAAGTEVSGVFTGTSYGTVKAGGFLSVNTTASTSTSTGAIVTYGGIGAAGDIYCANLHTGVVTADSMNPTSATITTLLATNFSTANAQITGGNVHVNYLRGSNFSSPNVLIGGGYVEGINRLQATNLSTGNLYVTGGEKIEGVISISGTTGSFTNLFASNALTANSSVHTVSVYGESYLYGNGTSILSSVNTSITDLWSNTAGLASAISSLSSGASSSSLDITNLWSNAASQATSINTLTSNAASQASDISTLYSNAATQATSISTLTSNAASQATDITNLWSNAATQATTLSSHASDISTLYSNAASQATDITNLWSNAATQATSINTLTSNAASQASDITTLYSNAATQSTAIAAKAPTDNPSFTTHVGVTGNVDVTGYIIATQDIIAFSDEKFKTNVTTITNALTTVRQLRGVFYDRIDTGEQGTGVIAQESLPHTPRLVRKTDSGDLAVAYGNHAGYFIESFKELADKVDMLVNEITDLKAEIKRLKGE